MGGGWLVGGVVVGEWLVSGGELVVWCEWWWWLVGGGEWVVGGWW